MAEDSSRAMASSRAARRCSSRLYARCSDRNWRARPIVLGQSFGGFVAQRYIERHPDHPSKVILSSTSPHKMQERKEAMFARLGGPARLR